MSEDINLAQVLSAALARKASGMRTGMPGRIVSYDDSKRRASVQPLIMDVDFDENGDRVTTTLPILNHVPVMFPGSGGRRIKWDVLPGDTVWLSFASSPIDIWKIQGGVVDPQDERKHHLADAVAYPGLDDFGHATDATPMINFTGGQIQAGGTSPLVTKAEFDAHTHPYTDDGAPSVTGTPTATITGTTIFKAGIVFVGWAIALAYLFLTLGSCS